MLSAMAHSPKAHGGDLDIGALAACSPDLVPRVGYPPETMDAPMGIWSCADCCRRVCMLQDELGQSTQLESTSRPVPVREPEATPRRDDCPRSSRHRRSRSMLLLPREVLSESDATLTHATLAPLPPREPLPRRRGLPVSSWPASLSSSATACSASWRY